MFVEVKREDDGIEYVNVDNIVTFGAVFGAANYDGAENYDRTEIEFINKIRRIYRIKTPELVALIWKCKGGIEIAAFGMNT